ncbi:hypothetical protein [Sulfurimonas sp.]|uniref:hypothetical protein n=2 Tax=Sulfurimonas TaxID=202746 RepID=UPI00356733F3
MERVKLMWLKELQIAIIEKDTQKIDELVSVPLKFDRVEDANSAMYLLAEASKLLHELKDETKQTMIQLKKNIDFLNSTKERSLGNFDICS